MIHFLQLIRYKNLLIIAATQYMMRWFIVFPMLKVNGFELQTDPLNFFLLVLSTLCISAAGYVINDYFDTRTDMINKPGQVVVGTKVRRRTAMLLHVVLSTVGIGLGTYLSFFAGIPAMAFIFALITGILWFYPTTYNRQFLVGNVIVALLIALVPFLVVVFEIPLLNREYSEYLIATQTNFNHLAGWVGGFSFFAFLTTLIREIIKDSEDFEGDRAYGSRTMPVVLGIKRTRQVAGVLIILDILALIFVYIRYLMADGYGHPDYITLVYFLLFLVLPLQWLLWLVVTARDKKRFHQAANVAKFIMLAGILYSLVVFLDVLK